MLPELAFIALLFVTVSAFLLAVVPQLGLYWRNARLIATAPMLAYSIGLCTIVSIGILAYSFSQDDFSLQYVAAHSNSQLPLLFKIAATWGGHEGSMLFWLFALSLWIVAFSLFANKKDPLFFTQTLSILGWISFSFAIFILFFSNPFERIFPAPFEGRDLNPMLQDIGLIFHPPLLYIGYVGFALNFAMTTAALLINRPISQLAQLMGIWVRIAWLFLTLGMAVGAWWAYYELGWGGWWFWDPVENASLMPWLFGLGLLHSLAVCKKRGIFNYWVSLFSLLSFIFSVLGTFIVRSGALTSVHAFAIDQQRGSMLLLIFFVLSVGAFSLFALKAQKQLAPSMGKVFLWRSKPSTILWLNILLSIAIVSTFLGTFYPMLFQAMNWGSISVGTPYFNRIFIPIIALLLILMVFVLMLRSNLNRLVFYRYIILLLISAILGYILIDQQNTPVFQFYWSAYVLLTLAIWLLLTTLWQLCYQFNMSALAMIIAHLGVAIATIGATLSSYYGSEIGVRLAPGQSQNLGQFEFQYKRFSNELRANFTAEVAQFEVLKQGQPYAQLTPERRHYDVRAITMSEVGIAGGFLGDLYVVMGDSKGNGEFSFRLHYKPLIRWLWAGAILMALGALIAIILPRRKNA